MMNKNKKLRQVEEEQSESVVSQSEDNEIYGSGQDEQDSDDDEIQELLHPNNQRKGNQQKAFSEISSGRVIGKTKKHFYGADGDDEDEQQDDKIQMNDQYAEAMRLQKFRAAKLKSFANQVGQVQEEEEEEGEKDSIQKIKENDKLNTIASKQSTKQRLMQIIEQQGTDQSDNEQEEQAQSKKAKKKEKIIQPRQLTIKDASQFGMALSEIAKSAQVLNFQVEPLLNQPYSKIGKKQGMSYLDVKNSLMLSYMTNLTFYLIMKAKGKTIEDHPVILRLASLKTLFDKLRPLDSTLQFQIQKAAQLAKNQKERNIILKDQDFKPRPGLMMADNLNQAGQDFDQVDEVQVQEQIESSKYRAPMMSTTLTDKQLSKQRKKLNSSKKNLARTALMKELREEMYDIPQQLFERQDLNRKELDQEAKIDEYQENQFKRVTLGKELKTKIKKQKKEAKEQIKLKAGLDGLSLNQLTNALNKNKQSELEVKQAEKRVAQQQEMKDSIYRTQVGRSLLKARKKIGVKVGKNEELNDFDIGEPSKKQKKKSQSKKAADIDNKIDDQFYQSEMKQLKKRKKEKKQRAQENKLASQADLLSKQEINQRNINYRMLKNKGLTRNRKKQDSNPRVKLHNKFKKAQKKRKNLVKEAVQQRGNYQGQETGLRTTIIKSRPLDG